MGRNLSSILNYDASQSQTFVVPAGSTINLDVEFGQLVSCKMGVQVNYAATASTTGCSLTIFDGYGPGDPTCPVTQPIRCKLGTAGSATTASGGTAYGIFAGNGTSITIVTTPTSQSSPQSNLTSVLFSDPVLRSTKWQRLQFTNNDLTNVATIKIWVDF